MTPIHFISHSLDHLIQILGVFCRLRGLSVYHRALASAPRVAYKSGHDARIVSQVAGECCQKAEAAVPLSG